MITYSRAKLADYAPAFDGIIVRYFQETSASEGVPPIDINWTPYLNLEEADMAFFVAAMDGDTLVGGNLYIVSNHLHHQTVSVAACDTLAVDTRYRGQGIGRRLIEFAEPLLVARGVSLVTHAFRHCYTDEPLFPSLGFHPTETTYLKKVA